MTRLSADVADPEIPATAFLPLVRYIVSMTGGSSVPRKVDHLFTPRRASGRSQSV
jgi:hypothetical protein